MTDPRKHVFAVVAGLAAFMIACRTTTPRSDVPPPTPAAADLKAIRVNGTVLNYVDTIASGARAELPPIVLVHGSIGSLREWRNQVPAMAVYTRTIAYSRRYHLPNPQVEDGQTYSASLHAADLAAFMTALRLQPADLVGSSYGGTVVVQLALHHPELVHSLILAEPALDVFTTQAADDSIRRQSAETLTGLDSTRARFARGDSISALRAFTDASLGRGAYDAVSAATRSYFISQLFELRKEMLAPPTEWMPRIQCAELQRLTMPVMVLVGQNTTSVYRGIIEQLQTCLRGTTVKVIPDAGHHVVANSASVNGAILDFVRQTAR